MNKTYKRNFLKAGSIAGQVRAFGLQLIQPGNSYNQAIIQILDKIKELGAIPAFPPQIALNEIAAHYLVPPGQDLTFKDQIVKLDVGICYEGAIGDCAATVDLSGHYQNIVDAVELALLNAEKSIQVGQKIRNVGKIINDSIEQFGLRSIKNLGGHGLGPYKIHTSPFFPNYDDRSSGIIRTGMTFAIEPFATNGIGFIEEDGESNIFSFNSPRYVTTQPARKILSTIKTFNQLPFSTHDLLSNHSCEEVESGLKELLLKEVIVGYPPLVEKGRGMVAQAENSVLVDEDGKVYITTRLS